MTFRSAKKVTQSGKHVFGLFISLQFLPPECDVLLITSCSVGLPPERRERREQRMRERKGEEREEGKDSGRER